MILLIRSYSWGQDTYRYCFSRDTLEILAKSNLERLEYIERYDTALVEIKNLKTRINIYQSIDSTYEDLTLGLKHSIDNRDEVIKAKDKKIKKQTKTIKIGKTIIIILTILTITGLCL